MTISAITVEKVAPRPFAAVRTLIPVLDIPKRFGEFLDQVYAAGKAGKVKLDGQNIFVYRAGPSDDVVEAEFGVGITEPFQPLGSVYQSEVPGGTAATATVTGPYSGIRPGHQAIVDWCKANGRSRSGVRWEVYGHWDPDPEKIRTDLYHQLR